MLRARPSVISSASMGPRSCNRGELTRISVRIAAAQLQWGRGHVTAERRQAIEATMQEGLLQWGRGHVTAERRS